MPAIGLAAAIIERRDPDAVIGSFAADHVIADPRRVPATRSGRPWPWRAPGGWSPSASRRPHPSTAFGYIRQGSPLAVEGAPRPGRWPSSSRSRTRRRRAATSRRAGSGGTRACSSPGPRAARPLDRYHHELAAGLRAIAADPSRLDATGPAWRRSPSTTPSPSRPRPTVWSPSCRPPFSWDDVGDFASLGAWSLPAPRRRTGSPSSATRPTSSRVDATGVVAAAAAGWSPSSGWTTSSSSTPRTRCWSSPATGRRTSRRSSTASRRPAART